MNRETIIFNVDDIEVCGLDMYCKLPNTTVFVGKSFKKRLSDTNVCSVRFTLLAFDEIPDYVPGSIILRDKNSYRDMCPIVEVKVGDTWMNFELGGTE